MFIDNIKPSPALNEFIRIYRVIDFHFPEGEPLFPKLYTPRPEICLQFYPKDRERIQYTNHEQPIMGNTSTLAGQHTVTHSRFVPKNFLSFQVVFQPGAFYRLTGIPAEMLTNYSLTADEIFGREADYINEQLLETKDYREMIKLVEAFLITVVKKVNKPQHPIDKIALLMLSDYEKYSLDFFIREACISQRQFDRKFSELAGISPKKFLRIIRFDKVFRMKNRFPERDWLTIAIHCGYYDYQHLVKDYKEFTGFTPTQFFEADTMGPDRILGVAEV